MGEPTLLVVVPERIHMGIEIFPKGFDNIQERDFNFIETHAKRQEFLFETGIQIDGHGPPGLRPPRQCQLPPELV